MKDNVIIGISGNIIVDKDGAFAGYQRAYVNCDYVSAVEKAGATPYIMPIIENIDFVRQQVENVDAIILSGGQDINPLLWSEEPDQKLGALLPKRDRFDMNLIKFALEMKKPILGVCRGCQILNVAEGGTLYQDLSLKEESYVKHNQVYLPSVATHTVELNKESRIYDILGNDLVEVNSFHHMSIKEVAPGYITSAIAKDGVIEAIEKKGDQFIIALQWHPEMLAQNSDSMLKIFKRLIEEAKK